MTLISLDELNQIKTLLGNGIKQMWHDEFNGIVSNCVENIISEALGDVVRTFTDKAYSTATITVHEVMREKRDPRNPNPRAGKSKVWVVRSDGKKVGNEHGAYDSAFIAAQNLHKTLIKNAEKALEHNPEFGSF